MKKDVLNEILNNPLLPVIKSKLERIKNFPELEFITRNCRDNAYGEIPTIRFKIGPKNNERQSWKFYKFASNYVRENCNILSIKNNLTTTFGHIDSLNNKDYRNIDIYLKNMNPNQQIKTFEVLAETFNDLLDRI